MTSPESSPAPVPSAAATPAAPASVPPTPADSAERPRNHVTVMHPEGIIPYAAEGLTLNQPLFARVTYRPKA